MPRVRALRRAAAIAVVAALTLGACSGSDLGEGSEEPDVLLQQGLRAHADGDLDAAEDLYLQVIELDPQNEFAYYNLGAIEQGRGDLEGAEEHYRTALQVNPDLVPALFNLAIVRTEADDPKEAVTLYERVIELQPENAAAHLNLGFVLVSQDKTKRGERELDEAVRLDPSLADRIEPATGAEEPIASASPSA